MSMNSASRGWLDLLFLLFFPSRAFDRGVTGICGRMAGRMAGWMVGTRSNIEACKWKAATRMRACARTSGRARTHLGSVLPSVRPRSRGRLCGARRDGSCRPTPTLRPGPTESGTAAASSPAAVPPSIRPPHRCSLERTHVIELTVGGCAGDACTVLLLCCLH